MIARRPGTQQASLATSRAARSFPANRYVDGVSSSCSVDLHLGRHSKRMPIWGPTN